MPRLAAAVRNATSRGRPQIDLPPLLVLEPPMLAAPPSHKHPVDALVFQRTAFQHVQSSRRGQAKPLGAS